MMTDKTLLEGYRLKKIDPGSPTREHAMAERPFPKVPQPWRDFREWRDWENMAGEFCDGKNHTGSLHATYDDPGEPHDGASRKIPRLQQTIPQDNHVGEPDEGERYPYRGMPRRTSPEAATLSEDAWWLMDAPMPLDQSRWILLEIPF